MNTLYVYNEYMCLPWNSDINENEFLNVMYLQNIIKAENLIFLNILYNLPFSKNK